ncbi:3-oxoacyl-[acyl-carrier-protein] synthase III C-terminal domain-containing protein [Virgibacillus pantothenticus]|uniref:3-oxoacyl-[acyl-carrier-protein] synthase III C-terminal domain-containing protein n=1 Tax=Virgibacillus pantothenticus TaxID=1473 RepID=UPI0009844DCE|nr:3-oxoacyl-[acyl-carrier-protein] synthase III C-terminal domain-containing protein [Virgibacillus pantothenticus]GIP63140.1 3-oxoacyl-ACP synthase [Virgibacillus pantothenticus]
MVGLAAIETYLPRKEKHICDLKDQLKLNDFQIKLFTRIHGLERIMQEPEQSLKQLLIKPIAKILKQVRSTDIKYIIYAHTIQTVSPYPINILEEIKYEFKLTHAISFSVTQHNCASALTAIEIASTLLKGIEGKILLITGEKPFTPLAQIIPNTTIMGEGSSASLITKNSTDNKLVLIERTTLGKYYSGINLKGELLKEFEKKYVDTLARTINSALNKANITLNKIKIIIPHNVNRSSWLKVIDLLNYDKEKVFLDNIPKIGHCFCSDSFINLNDVSKKGLMNKGEYFLLVNVGLGATFSVGVFQY